MFTPVFNENYFIGFTIQGEPTQESLQGYLQHCLGWYHRDTENMARSILATEGSKTPYNHPDTLVVVDKKTKQLYLVLNKQDCISTFLHMSEESYQKMVVTPSDSRIKTDYNTVSLGVLIRDFQAGAPHTHTPEMLSRITSILTEVWKKEKQDSFAILAGWNNVLTEKDSTSNLHSRLIDLVLSAVPDPEFTDILVPVATGNQIVDTLRSPVVSQLYAEDVILYYSNLPFIDKKFYVNGHLHTLGQLELDVPSYCQDHEWLILGFNKPDANPPTLAFAITAKGIFVYKVVLPTISMQIKGKTDEELDQAQLWVKEHRCTNGVVVKLSSKVVGGGIQLPVSLFNIDNPDRDHSLALIIRIVNEVKGYFPEGFTDMPWGPAIVELHAGGVPPVRREGKWMYPENVLFVVDYGSKTIKIQMI